MKQDRYLSDVCEVRIPITAHLGQDMRRPNNGFMRIICKVSKATVIDTIEKLRSLKYWGFQLSIDDDGKLLIHAEDPY